MVDASADLAASMSQLAKIVDIQPITSPTSIVYLARPYDTKGSDLRMIGQAVQATRDLLIRYDLSKLDTKTSRKLFGRLLIEAGVTASIRRAIQQLIGGHQMTATIPNELDPATLRRALETAVQRMDTKFTEANVMFVTSHEALLRVKEAMINDFMGVPTAKSSPSPITHVGNIGKVKVYLIEGVSDLLVGQVMLTTIGLVKLIGDASVIYSPLSVLTPVDEGDEVAFYIEHTATHHALDDSAYVNIIQVL